MGGHVIFSHYSYFDQLLNTAVGSGELCLLQHAVQQLTCQSAHTSGNGIMVLLKQPRKLACR